MSELRVFIADDEAPARERLKELLGDIATELPTRVVGEARNGFEVIEQAPASGAQVLLLDIQMPGMGGLEVARHLAALREPPAVVFVTAHDRHAVEAFELNALDYLLKPVRATRLAAALARARAAGSSERGALERAAERLHDRPLGGRDHLAVAERNRIVLVPVRSIVYLKAEQKYVTLRTAEREHLIEESLVALEREFSGQFVRIHRNCLVGRAAIRGFERAAPSNEEPHWLVVLDGVPERLPVSRRQWPTLRALTAEKP
jgi:two-component system response regulator AlgR